MASDPPFSRVDQIVLSIGFFTRIPVSLPRELPVDALARSVWAFPLAGVVIGIAAALTMGLAQAFGLSGTISAVMAVTMSIALTGALHEDGLADTADGFGGGSDRSAKLAIMRDSRIGSYGVLALLVSFALRVACLSQLSSHGESAVSAALVATHAGARAAIPAVMASLPLARPTGVAASAGRPENNDIAVAIAIGVSISLIFLGLTRSIIAAAAVSLVVAGLGRLAFRQIGGYTGDVLGAAEQIAETVLLLVAAGG